MTPEQVAAAVAPHLHERRHATPWGREAWDGHLRTVAAVLAHAGTGATRQVRADTLAEAATLLDTGGWHDAADLLREEAGIPDPDDLALRELDLGRDEADEPVRSIPQAGVVAPALRLVREGSA